MLTEELKEKKQRWLQEVQAEFVRLNRERRLLFPMVKANVAEALLLLMADDQQGAWWSLSDAHRWLLPAQDRKYFYSLWQLEQSQYALSILDLGIFAYRLTGSFFQLHDIVQHLWESRKVFQPHLSGVLRATYTFRCLLEAGHNLQSALVRALQSRNELYEMFGCEYIFRFRENIGMLLSREAMAKLKIILENICTQTHDHTR
jgi:hypothetical protein